MNARTRWTASCLLAILALLAVCGSPGTADARIVRIQVTATESPTFGGYSWPGVGQYEKVVGKAFGEVDPFDTKNAVIARAAERRRQGRVLVRLLHPQADRPQSRRAQGDVRAAEPGPQNVGKLRTHAQ